MSAYPKVFPAPAANALRDLGVELQRRHVTCYLPGRRAYYGTYQQQRVVVTVRLLLRPDAVASHNIEQTLYHAAAGGDCPLPLPTAIYLDEYVTVAAAFSQPTPSDSVSEAALVDLLDRLNWLHTWTPPPPHDQPLPEPPIASTLSRYHQCGLLRQSTAAAIHAVVGVKPRRRLELGDGPLDRCQFNPTALSALFGPFDAGWRLAGYDWAELHLRFADTHPWLAKELIERSERANLSVTYAASLVLAACRQLCRGGIDPQREQRLRGQLEAAQRRLYLLYEASL
ncbi:hypothetical protein [Hamadaea tsunoensis]|uniref:hypothetical protein n=1 Tax=Hamadaea tsunoensis TaxID=53368 RepID=UPI0004292CD7|nr:hypothetical protein [Hamadaea tsunoensis]